MRLAQLEAYVLHLERRLQATDVERPAPRLSEERDTAAVGVSDLVSPVARPDPDPSPWPLPCRRKWM